MKECTKCKVSKQTTEFNNYKANKDGKASDCRECHRKYHQKVYGPKQLPYDKKLSDKLYREKNKEKIAKQKKKYRTEHKEKVAKQKKESSARNKETIIAYRKTETYKVSSINTRAKRKVNKLNGFDRTIPKKIHKIVTKNLLALLEGQKYKCNECNCCLVDNEKHLDHYVPLSNGGAHSITNVQWLCRECNMSKFTTMPINPLVFRLHW